MNIITFSYPQTINVSSKNKIENTFEKKYNITECLMCNNGNIISQSVNPKNDDIIKVTTIKKPKNSLGNLEYKTVQNFSPDGSFSSVRLVDNKIVSGYVFKPYEKLFSNKFSKGLKGLFEKISWNILNNKNGCERTFLIKLINKIK